MGFPDFDPPEQLIEALKKAAEEGLISYEINMGLTLFREAVAKKQNIYGYKTQP
jgi:aminotransferase